MRFKTKYKVCLYKKYFDTGYGITSYLKYLVAFFGLASRDVKTTLIIGLAYGIFCFFFGLWWYRSNFVRADQEVNNDYNLFVEEMRKEIKKLKPLSNA